MFLFSRRARLGGGDLRGGMSWVTRMTEEVNRTTDLQVRLHISAFSPQVGSVAWSTVVENLSELEAADDALMGSDLYHQLLAEGQPHILVPADDQVATVVHGAFDPERESTHANVVQAVLAAGSALRGVEMGIEIAQTAERITGIPTVFTTSLTGTYGGVGWVTLYDSLDQLQQAEAALGANADWLELIDSKITGAYAEEPAFTQQTVWRRLV